MYNGIHRAKVVSSEDPEKRGRLLVQLPTVLQNRDGGLPTVWVEPCWSSFNRDLPTPGTIVLVAFEYPCTVMTSGFWLGIIDYAPNGFSESPVQAQQNPETDFPGGRGVGTAAFGDLTDLGTTGEDNILAANSIEEPPSFQDTTYGKNHVRRTPGGMVEEWDDGASPNDFEGHRYNRLVGAHQTEIRGDGAEYRRASVRMEFLLNEQRVLEGDREQIVGGHERTLTEGTRVFEIDGSLIGTSGPVRVQLSSLDVAIDREGDEVGTRMSSGGALTLEAMGSLLAVAGDVAAFARDKLYLASGGRADFRGADGVSLSSAGGTVGLHGSKVVVTADAGDPTLNAAAVTAASLAGFAPIVMSPAQFEAFMAYITAHTHPVAGTKTLPPLQGAAVTAALSSVLIVQAEV